MENTQTTPKYTILVVEDEKLLLDAITKKLELSNYHAVGVMSGKEAFELLQKQEVVPDAIWLDYYLKDINGMEFMQHVRQLPQLSHLPVIVVSNSASSDKVQSMLALGVTKYVLKAEHKLSDLIEMLGTFIREEQERNHG